MKTILLSIILSILSSTAIAATESPYSGQEKRDIKALSAQQIADYLSGSGMGYAKAAELNQYPGPRHVLDLADELALSAEQIKQTEAIYQAMQTQAVALGKQLVAKEKELDQKFADGSIDASSLEELVAAISMLEGKLRQVHLAAHLEQKALLSQHQIHRYDQLRGYGLANRQGHSHAH